MWATSPLVAATSRKSLAEFSTWEAGEVTGGGGRLEAFEASGGLGQGPQKHYVQNSTSCEDRWLQTHLDLSDPEAEQSQQPSRSNCFLETA